MKEERVQKGFDEEGDDAAGPFRRLGLGRRQSFHGLNGVLQNVAEVTEIAFGRPGIYGQIRSRPPTATGPPNIKAEWPATNRQNDRRRKSTPSEKRAGVNSRNKFLPAFAPPRRQQRGLEETRRFVVREFQRQGRVKQSCFPKTKMFPISFGSFSQVTQIGTVMTNLYCHTGKGGNCLSETVTAGRHGRTTDHAFPAT